VVTEVSSVPFAWCSAVWLLAFVVAQPLRIILIALALQACGVPKAAVARWALRQADRNSFAMLLKLFQQLRRGDRSDNRGEPPA
jgi:hypothetical protein